MRMTKSSRVNFEEFCKEFGIETNQKLNDKFETIKNTNKRNIEKDYMSERKQ